MMTGVLSAEQANRLEYIRQSLSRLIDEVNMVASSQPPCHASDAPMVGYLDMSSRELGEPRKVRPARRAARRTHVPEVSVVGADAGSVGTSLMNGHADRNGSDESKSPRQALVELGKAATVQEISEHLGIPRQVVRNRLSSLLVRGVVRPVPGSSPRMYELTTKGQ